MLHHCFALRSGPTPDATRRHSLLGVAIGAALALTGCANMGFHQLRSDVSSYGDWPVTRNPGAFTFERLPSQASEPDEQNHIEAAALPALNTAGFTQAPPDQVVPYTVQVGTVVRGWSRVDPAWPYGAPPPYWARPSLGGGWWGGGGVAFSMRMDPPTVQMQVSVVIRDRQTHAVLYESRASTTRVGQADGYLWQPLFSAALKDFPLAGGPRSVTVPLDAANP